MLNQKASIKQGISLRLPKLVLGRQGPNGENSATDIGHFQTRCKKKWNMFLLAEVI